MTFALPQPNAAQFFQVKRLNFRSVAMLAMSLGLMLAATPLLTTAAAASDAPGSAHLDDGIYLFGESPEIDQMGTTYMVAEVSEGQIVGGFYQPNSSFDCFHGEVANNEMALTVVDSYEQTEYAYAMPLDSRETVASQTGGAVKWVPSGFHAVTEFSPTAENVLTTCRAVL